MELEQCRELVAKETKHRENLEQDLLESSAELRRQVIIGHHGDQERKRLESIIDAVAIINPKQVLHLKSLQLAFQFKPRKVLPSKPPDDYIDSRSSSSSQLFDDVATPSNNKPETADKKTDISVISMGSNQEELSSFENVSFNEIQQTPIQNNIVPPIENRENNQELNDNNNNIQASSFSSSSSSFLDTQNNKNIIINNNNNNNNNIDESDYILLLRVKWILSKFDKWEEFLKNKNDNEEEEKNLIEQTNNEELALEENINSTSDELVEEKSTDTEETINVNNLDGTPSISGNDDNNHLSTEKNEPEKIVFPTFPPTTRPPILIGANKVENKQNDYLPLNNDLTFVNSSFLIFSFLEFIKNGKIILS